MDEVSIHIEAAVNPTEDLKKVKNAVKNLFGNMTFETRPAHRGDLLVAETSGTTGPALFRDLLQRERIRDAARGVLLKGIKGKSIIFYLNKQVAFAGHISFSQAVGESPLGPIKIEIRCDNPKDLVEWLSPRTKKSGKRRPSGDRFA